MSLDMMLCVFHPSNCFLTKFTFLLHPPVQPPHPSCKRTSRLLCFARLRLVAKICQTNKQHAVLDSWIAQTIAMIAIQSDDINYNSTDASGCISLILDVTLQHPKTAHSFIKEKRVLIWIHRRPHWSIYFSTVPCIASRKCF